MFCQGAHGHLKLALQISALVNLREHHEGMVVLLQARPLHNSILFMIVMHRSCVHGEVSIIAVGVVTCLGLLYSLCGAGEVFLLGAKVIERHHSHGCSQQQHDLIQPEGADPSHGDGEQT